MSKIKEFIKTHKKMSIITCVVVVLLIAAIVVSLVLIGHNDRKILTRRHLLKTGIILLPI